MRILVIDDAIQVAPNSRIFNLVSGLLTAPTPHKVFVSKSVGCVTSDFLSGADKPEHPTDTIQHLEKFLRTIDVLVLDLGEAGDLQEEQRLTREKIKGNLSAVDRGETDISDSDLEAAKSSLSGIGFYHLHYDSLRKIQAVFVLTRYDGTGDEDETNEGIVRKLIDPFCGIDQWTPYTAKYHKSKNDLDLLKERLECLADLFYDRSLQRHRYISLDNLSGIEFAATHNEPVMLIGESGTGKEYTAKAIHQRWAQERIRAKELPQPSNGYDVTKNFAAVNCALLSETLGDITLFGHLVGAFTGPRDHSLGMILKKGCGIRLTPSQNPAPDDLQRRTGNIPPCLTPADGSVDLQIALPRDVKPGTPLGTLFLDEFGDLHPSVQAKLLRFLQEWEVEMMGLNGVVRGARLRIIAATSDPRFAAFAGYGNDKDRLRGQYRTPDEERRPLRADLLFRVKGQTIRVDAVTKDNVADVVDLFIRHSDHADEWSADARAKLIGAFAAQIEAVDAYQPGSGSVHPVFGHKREIATTMRLIELFSATARVRGGRPTSDKITSSHVEAVFRPSGILMPTDLTQRVTGSAGKVVDPAVQQFEDKVRSGIKAALIACDQRHLADSGWVEYQLRQSIHNATHEQKAILNKALNLSTRGWSEVFYESYLRAVGYSPIPEDIGGLKERVKSVADLFKGFKKSTI